MISIDPYENPSETCHSNAVVRMNVREPHKNRIWIIAKDIDTEDLLQCETKISKIDLIEITTELNNIVDVGNYRVLKAVAKNKDGVLISTLEGVQFEWTSDNEEIVKLNLLKNSAID